MLTPFAGERGDVCGIGDSSLLRGMRVVEAFLVGFLVFFFVEAGGFAGTTSGLVTKDADGKMFCCLRARFFARLNLEGGRCWDEPSGFTMCWGVPGHRPHSTGWPYPSKEPGKGGAQQTCTWAKHLPH